MLCYAVSKEGSGRFGALFVPERALTTRWHSQIVGLPKQWRLQASLGSKALLTWASAKAGSGL